MALVHPDPAVEAVYANLQSCIRQAQAERDEIAQKVADDLELTYRMQYAGRTERAEASLAKAVEGLREIVRVGAYEPEGAALVEMVRSILAEIEEKEPDLCPVCSEEPRLGPGRPCRRCDRNLLEERETRI